MMGKNQKSWEYVRESINRSTDHIDQGLERRRVASEMDERDTFYHFNQRIQDGFIQYLRNKNVQGRTTLQKPSYLRRNRSSYQLLPYRNKMRNIDTRNKLNPSKSYSEIVNSSSKSDEIEHFVPLNRNVFDMKNSTLIPKTKTNSLSNTNANTMTTTIDIGYNQVVNLETKSPMHTRRANRACSFLKSKLVEPYAHHDNLIKRKISVRNDKIFQKRWNQKMRRSNGHYVIGITHKARLHY